MPSLMMIWRSTFEHTQSDSFKYFNRKEAFYSWLRVLNKCLNVDFITTSFITNSFSWYVVILIKKIEKKLLFALQWYFLQIYQHQINGVHALAKCMGWQFLANSCHLGIGAVEMLGNASSCILASPIGDRSVSFFLSLILLLVDLGYLRIVIWMDRSKWQFKVNCLEFCLYICLFV